MAKPIKKRKSAFQSLLSLPPEKLAAIDTHLLSEGSVVELVRMIRNKWGLFTEMAEESLRRQLYRYKAELIEPKQVAIAAKFSDDDMLKRVASKVDELGVRFEPLAEMEKLVHTQLARVEKLSLLEAKAPTLLDSQTKNIMVLHTMLKDLTSLHMDVGMLAKVPQKHEHLLTAEQQARVTEMKAGEQEHQATLMALEYLAQEGVLEGDYEEINE